MNTNKNADVVQHGVEPRPVQVENSGQGLTSAYVDWVVVCPFTSSTYTVIGVSKDGINNVTWNDIDSVLLRRQKMLSVSMLNTNDAYIYRWIPAPLLDYLKNHVGLKDTVFVYITTVTFGVLSCLHLSKEGRMVFVEPHIIRR